MKINAKARLVSAKSPLGDLPEFEEMSQKPTSVRFLRYLNRVYDVCNAKCFKNKLVKPKLLVQLPKAPFGQAKDAIGLWNPRARELTINPLAFKALSESELQEIIMHEMCHQAVSELIKATKEERRKNNLANGGHGDLWKQEMRKLGLPTRSNISWSMRNKLDDHTLKKRKENLVITDPEVGKFVKIINDEAPRGSLLVGIILRKVGSFWEVVCATKTHYYVATCHVGSKFFKVLPEDSSKEFKEKLKKGYALYLLEIKKMKINAKARLRSLYEPKQIKMLETEKPEEPVKPNVPEKPVAPTKPTKPVEPVKPESVGEQDKEKPVEATVSIQCPNCLDNPEWVKGHRDVLTRGRFWKCGSCNHTISRPPYKLNQD